MPDILPAPMANGNSEEVKDAAAALRVGKWIWKHKKDLAFFAAMGMLFLKGDTSVLALVGIQPPQKSRQVMAADISPVDETWKQSVDKRFERLERQNRIIIKLLTDGE